MGQSMKKNTYDSVMQDVTLSAAAKVTYIIMAARGTQCTKEQIGKDLYDLHELMYEMQIQMEDL